VSYDFDEDNKGRLEIYYYDLPSGGSSWVPFCADYFNSETAERACHQLGFAGYSDYGRVDYLG